MVSISYSSLTFPGTCPHCASPLFELSDMWGPFYACEGCGYEFDPLELGPAHLRPKGQTAFIGGFWLNRNNGTDGMRMVWQTSGATPGLPLG
jgi:hypothetical protein